MFTTCCPFGVVAAAVGQAETGRGEKLGLDLSGPCSENTPSYSYDDLLTVRSLRYGDMVDAVMLDFLFGSNMHLVQLIAIQYKGKNARLRIALPLYHTPLTNSTLHYLLRMYVSSALACTSRHLQHASKSTYIGRRHARCTGYVWSPERRRQQLGRTARVIPTIIPTY